MPVYGVESYIERAINSIVEQTFSDWELIVVDDCTPDKSGEIAASVSSRISSSIFLYAIGRSNCSFAIFLAFSPIFSRLSLSAHSSSIISVKSKEHMMETNARHIPFFSIVMPVYGVESYIERAINSIVAFVSIICSLLLRMPQSFPSSDSVSSRISSSIFLYAIVFGLSEEYFDKNGAYSYSHEVKPEEGYFSDKESLRKV